MSLKDRSLKDKKVLVRVDFNVPMENGKVKDVSRITASLPTIEYLIDQGAKVILLSHLGRPKGKPVQELSLAPVAEVLAEKLGKPVSFLQSDQVVDENVKEKVSTLSSGEVALLENTRFRPEEEKNDPTFAKELASLGEFFINDAFGTSHRAHVSNVGLGTLLPCDLGFLVQKEVDTLGEILDNPDRPFIGILGGAKVSDKIGVIDNLLNKVDKLIIVGAMAYTFLRAKGIDTGISLVEEDKIDLAKKLLEKAEKLKVPLYLPVDFVVAKDFEGTGKEIIDANSFPKDKEGLDIGPKSLELFTDILKDGKTVFWNGPAGVFEKEDFAKGTYGLAKVLANLDGTTVIGGGDSSRAVTQMGLDTAMTHISTGGGASLEFMEGKTLPGVAIVEE
ncbi:MAG: phosphoglycerate kinase [Tissierellia bacterium]|nr:phosphoglycerate kinase [Tissierellia bacterium]